MDVEYFVHVSFPHSHLDAKTVVTFARYLLVSCKYGPAILTCAHDSLEGHPQQEHETRHGSMSRTRWTVEGPDDVPVEIEGRKFSTNDEGAPMMCNLVCAAMGRHIHIDYCRATDEAACHGNREVQHMTNKMQPDPNRAKDVLTHSLFWQRSGVCLLGAFALSDRSSELSLDRFQGPVLERSAGQLCEMVGFRLGFLLARIDS